MSMIYFNEIEHLIDAYKYGDNDEVTIAEEEFQSAYGESLHKAVAFSKMTIRGEAPYSFCKICKENVEAIRHSIWITLFEGGCDEEIFEWFGDDFEDRLYYCNTVKELKSILKLLNKDGDAWFVVKGGYYIEWL